MIIRRFQQTDIPAIIAIWNASVSAGEVVYKPIDTPYFNEKFNSSEIFVAEAQGRAVGFVIGASGFLTAIFVEKAYRGQGVGKALLSAFEKGKSFILCREDNPVQLDWLIPGKPGHDHNKAPGMDIGCAGYGFLLSQGYAEQRRDVAMHMDLSEYKASPKIEEIRQKLSDEGIITGPYDPSLGYDYARMCGRLPGEYWQSAIEKAINDPERRTLLAATDGRCLVGFTGPVGRQASGRGYFLGICTDPAYEKRGIASVLFNLLLQEFIAVGATFSTLYTADTNHAQRVYLRTGFEVVRRFAAMGKHISDSYNERMPL